MTILLPIVQTLRDCLETALAGTPWPLPSERVQLRHGEQGIADRARSEDECCPGIAWVRIAGTDVLQLRGTEALMYGCFNPMRTTTVELSVTRCMPTPGPDALVTADQWAEVSTRADSDHGAMEAAVCCFLEDPPPQYQDWGVILRPGAYVPVGPDANCIGGTLTVQFEHDCRCGSGG
jgi:hypothetical protein